MMTKKLTDISPEELMQIVNSPLPNAKVSEQLGVTKSTVRYVRYVYYHSPDGWNGLVQRMWKRMEERGQTSDVRILTFDQYKRELKEKRKGGN